MLLDMNETEDIPEVNNRLQELENILTDFQSEYQNIQEDVNSLANDWESMKKQISQVGSDLDSIKEALPVDSESDSNVTIWKHREAANEALSKINNIENQIDVMEGDLAIFKQCQDLMETVQYFRQLQKKFEFTASNCKNLISSHENVLFKRFKDLIESCEKEFNAEIKKLREGVQVSYSNAENLETQRKDLENNLSSYLKTLEKKEAELTELYELISKIGPPTDKPFDAEKLIST
jgi:chromosome segregation ATPase